MPVRKPRSFRSVSRLRPFGWVFSNRTCHVCVSVCLGVSFHMEFFWGCRILRGYIKSIKINQTPWWCWCKEVRITACPQHMLMKLRWNRFLGAHNFGMNTEHRLCSYNEPRTIGSYIALLSLFYDYIPGDTISFKKWLDNNDNKICSRTANSSTFRIKSSMSIFWSNIRTLVTLVELHDTLTYFIYLYLCLSKFT